MEQTPRPKRSLSFSPDTLRMIALALVTALIWCWAEHRWTASQWQLPVEYMKEQGSMDTMSVFAAIKTTADGYCFPFASKENPWLGAPFVANWNDYPNNEQVQYFLAGVLADSVGLFAAANAWMMIQFVPSSVAFYFVCRRFRVTWPWAFAGGLVFAFAPFSFAHGMHHLTVAAYWHLPLCLLICRYAARGGGVQWGGRRFWFAAGVAVLTGMQNIYFAVMFVQLLGLCCLLQAFRKRWGAVIGAVILGTITTGTYILMCSSTFLYHFQHGPNAGVVSRKYFELETTALKFVDFFMPWQHRLPGYADWTKEYLTGAWLKGENPPACYFGIVGLVGLAWFAARVIRRVFLAKPAKPISMEAIFFAWVFLYATVGGINGLLGSTGFILLRSTTRYSIVLLCIVLLFLMRRLSSLASRKSALPVMAIAAVMAVLALWDQLPAFKTDADLRETAMLVNSDRSFTETIEARLPEKAMIFEVPIMDFPEHPHSIPSYEHFRPYIYSTKLRFSFGSDKGRPEADWQHQIESLSLDQAVARLEQLGFSAILVNRKGVANSGHDMEKALHDLGRTEIIRSPNDDLYCVLLHPVAQH